MKNYVIGLDFGSDSVRAVLLDADSGRELASEVYEFPRWKEQKFCNPSKNQYRQHPLDHVEGMEKTIKGVVRKSNINGAHVRGICIDTTGSSPIAVTKEGTPLSMVKGFEENPNAMLVLWKDHTAIAEANQINELAKTWGGEDYTKFVGGIYSSEWFWAKIAHIVKEDEAVKSAAYSWMEHCDLMTFMLVDNQNLETFKRSRCAAGHKAMWHKSWGGLPSAQFLSKLDPYLGELRGRLYEETFTSDQIAGHLNQVWADKLDLSTDCVVAVGIFDAHAGAVGAKIDKHTLVRVMGTSTCDIIVSSDENVREKTIRGICGQVEGSVIPRMIGLEAGQSAFGDVLAWFTDVLFWPIDNLVLTSDILSADQKKRLKKEAQTNFITRLSEEAEKLDLSQSLPIALDWINGRRTPDANQELKSAISHLSLGTKAPHIFKALINAICFGSKEIVDRFEEEGVEINSVIGIGGVARKSPFIMQTLANVLDMPIKIAASDEAPALGAAIYAAVAAGLYPDVIAASKTLGSDFEAEYLPNHQVTKVYQEQMRAYKELGAFVENNINRKLTSIDE